MASNQQLDLHRLRTRLREKPRTKAGQVRQAWPDIKDLLVAGHSLKDICAWLNEIGLEIGYARLSHYVGQLRRRDEAVELQRRESNTISPASAASLAPEIDRDVHSSISVPRPAISAGREADPLANVLERESNRPGFNYNAEPDPGKLI